MAVKATTWRIRGMNRDTDPLVYSNEFAYENRNIRITASSDSTLLGIANIKGTQPIILNIKPVGSEDQTPESRLVGTPIGITTIVEYMVLFTHSEEADYIYRIVLNGNQAEVCILAKGDFGFSTEHPIEAIPYYEANDVINVYWTDGLNQIRKINIVDSAIIKKDKDEGIVYTIPIENTNKLDFIASFNTPPIKGVSVQKQYSVGNFPSGVIQYFITAFNKFGQETNILYETPLYYMSPSDRGGTAEESNVNSFAITIKVKEGDNYELEDFSYLRVYSTHRTSVNDTPAAHIVTDIPLTGADTYTINDTGYGLESIDPTSLLYKEREPFSAGTFAQKDNVLFIGDINLLGSDNEDFNTIKDYFSTHSVNYTETYEYIDYYKPTGIYPYDSNLDESNLSLKGFKCHDYYKIGLQFQRKTGEWTSVIPLNFSDGNEGLQDWIRTTHYPRIEYSNNTIGIPKISLINIFTQEIRNLVQKNYIAARAVIAEPILGHKSIRYQGILCPTLYNMQDRRSNSPYSVSSWFIRPFLYKDEPIERDHDSYYVKYGRNYTHNRPLPASFEVYFSGMWTREVLISDPVAEIQNSTYIDPYIEFSSKGYGYTNTFHEWQQQSTNYIVDQNILTFHSPDVDDTVAHSQSINAKVRIIGLVPITSYTSDYIIQANSNANKGIGEIAKDIYDNNICDYPNWLISDYLWNDNIVNESTSSNAQLLYNYVTYVWHRNGSLNNDRGLNNTDNAQTALLKHKVYANLKYSYYTAYFNDIENNNNPDGVDGVDLTPNQLSLYSFNSNETQAIRLGSNIYMGNVDKVATWTPYTLSTSGLITGNEDFKCLSSGYPITAWSVSKDMLDSVARTDANSSINTEYKIGIEPVSVKYKSTPHLVFQLPVEADTWVKTIIPRMNIENYQVNSPFTAPMVDNNYPVWSIYFEDYDQHNKFEYHIWNYIGNGMPTNEGNYFIYNYNENPLLGIYGWFCSVDSNGSLSIINNNGVNVGDFIIQTSDNNVDNILRITSINSVSDFISPYGTTNVYYYEAPYSNKYCSQQLIHILEDNTSATSPQDDTYYAHIAKQEYQYITGNSNTAMLYLAEVYEDIEADEIYGTNYENIRWDVASEPININYFIGTPLVISGDTYFQRWDCLKTYPFTNEDQNSVVEIVSFMVETQKNIAARTDRNRGVQTNVSMNPTNFNLYNEVYNQSQDFIPNVYLEDSNLVNNNFPNTIYWSLTKTLREEIDTWAAITLSNSLDMDGDKGKVNAIRRYNNNLLVFQDTGLSQILYNENMQIASTTGVPIEIANSGLVSGKRYISNTIGCKNKWTIVTGENSLYFMDSFNKGIYKFDNQLTNLTSSLGFNSWADSIKIGEWLPEISDDNIFLAGYDKQNKEVHFMNKNESLVYSEQLGAFMTFMDIKRTPFISNVQDRVIAVNTEENNFDNYGIYELNTGKYNTFFNKAYPFYTQVIANPEPTLDKVFNVLEFRADVLYQDDEGHQKVDNSKLPFNTFRIWNEYQDSNDKTLQLINGKPSNLKRKFRVWRINNFRDSGSIDRIRNPWVFFKLSNSGQDNSKVTLHDMVMYYFV